MALSHSQKDSIVQGYSERVARAQVMVWGHYRGMTMPQMQDLRRQLRPVGGEAVVVKNTLMRRALEQAKIPVDNEMTAGPCLVTFMYGDLAAATKVVRDFARLNEAVFQVAGGVVGRKLATVEQINSLIALPSREAMLARVIGGMQAPISGLVGTLGAVLRGLVNVLDARAKQLDGAPA